VGRRIGPNVTKYWKLHVFRTVCDGCLAWTVVGGGVIGYGERGRRVIVF